MPVYSNIVCGKLVRWWACPFCNKKIIAIYPDYVGQCARRHLLFHHEDASEEDVKKAMDDLQRWYTSYGSGDEILTEAVLDKL